MRKPAGLSGYFTVARALKASFEREGPWSADSLAAMTAERCAAVFGQPPGFPLLELFAQALRDLGRLLLDRYDGSPTALVAAADGSAARLVDLLTAMPFFRDVATHDGQAVAFYKRAQLTAADLALALDTLRQRDGAAGPHEPVGGADPLFRDLDHLTIFADNLVPHVLRVDGVLRYDPALLARIDAERLLEPGSPEEVEIRACAVHAVELVKETLSRQGHPVTATQLDYFLWNRGQAPEYKALPRHRARSVFY